MDNKTKPNSYENLNNFLAETLLGIRDKTITIEEADKISKVADKINKNNIAAILHNKQTRDKSKLDFFNPES